MFGIWSYYCGRCVLAGAGGADGGESMMDYLLVEHKDRCWDCDLMRIEEMHEIPFCGRTGGRVEMDGKPDWCPLRPIPERKTKDRPIPDELPAAQMDILLNGWDRGWNACLAEIEGIEGED